MQDITAYERTLVTAFTRNPVGMLVQLRDGSEVKVERARSTTTGRMLMVRRPFGLPYWVPERAVVAVVYFQAALS